MASEHWYLLLADDDDDDVHFFKEALDDLPITARLEVVQDGEQLIQWLSRPAEPLPDVLFLDLNMPRKGGAECLVELKRDLKLEHLPVVILSTYFEPAMANLLYKNGAHYCMRKPTDFFRLKQLIHQVLTLLASANGQQPPKEGFVLNGTLN
ncbi:hypothetical protein GCM10027275_51880 [Rhabdobacter roseus]|uniref:CheY-like chemotaxis protein n=1 Tax=Rhabdobacter roseus TaxID=1655419 RepID=A0A840U107_9BACT|nr:response regulator [Rhabdobacter roseus]MBB5287263.1 CheY-like chemotaxis protein [Rhabdobacter roseus]